ncbi:MAG: diphosphomevalonate/mevalonate 3,5-bisphosphate decarboxylase family protein, partial [Holosporales bacterium]
LSCLARFGSGSACRSLWQGFVLWNRGNQEDGLDSHGTPLPFLMPDLAAGIILLKESPKEISSREAMAITQKTSPGYSQWVTHTEKDLVSIQKIIQEADFKALGDLTEKNALALHEVMGLATPSISYTNQETLATIERIYELRSQGLSVYWTQDAGPNLKLLFLKKDEGMVRNAFPNLWVSDPFAAFVF